VNTIESELKCRFWFRCRENLIRYFEWRVRNFEVQCALKETTTSRCRRKRNVFSSIIDSLDEKLNVMKSSIKQSIIVFSLIESNWRATLYSDRLRFFFKRRLMMIRLISNIIIVLRIEHFSFWTTATIKVSLSSFNNNLSFLSEEDLYVKTRSINNDENERNDSSSSTSNSTVIRIYEKKSCSIFSLIKSTVILKWSFNVSK
jgi:hypothetical protein